MSAVGGTPKREIDRQIYQASNLERYASQKLAVMKYSYETKQFIDAHNEVFTSSQRTKARIDYDTARKNVVRDLDALNRFTARSAIVFKKHERINKNRAAVYSASHTERPAPNAFSTAYFSDACRPGPLIQAGAGNVGQLGWKTRVRSSMLSRGKDSGGVVGSVNEVCGMKRARPSVLVSAIFSSSAWSRRISGT
jgi:hypothetical protein